MKKYRFIVKSKCGDYIIDMTENLTESAVRERINWFMENGYYQMADYKVEIM